MEILTGDAKLSWGATLKPGDVVNDCKFRDIKIKTIKPRKYEMDSKVGNKVTKKGEVFDFDIVLEDGGQCSLMHCCNRPEEIPNRIKSLIIKVGKIRKIKVNKKISDY